MSYGIVSPCWNCQKNKDCKDLLRICEGVNKVYEKPEEHKGSGQVTIMCCKVKPINE